MNSTGPTRSPIFGSSAGSEEGVKRRAMSRASDRNRVPLGLVLTSPTSHTAPSTTSCGVIVARVETKANAGNKKPIQPSSPARNGFHARSSEGNASSADTDEYGIWENPGQLVKTSSQGSIIVQAQLDRTPSSEEGGLADSVYSQASIATVVRRNAKLTNSDSSTTMNDLPSYELASAYVQSNVYAQMCNPKMPNEPVTTQPPTDSEQSSPGKSTVATAASAGQQRMAQLARESSLEPIGEEERLVQMTQAIINSQPSRSKRAEVLRFFSAATAFQVRVVGGDIQITDMDGCPLFDAYQELDCRQRWWNVEAYGDRVLLMREELSVGDGSSSWGSRVTITDWNGELFGYLVTGDPLRLESAERVGIGRFFSQPSVVNNAACSNATSVPKACWVCQADGQDGQEQPVARLEGYQKIVFLGDSSGANAGQQHLNFHLKLMALAGVIRIVGSLTVTAVSDCMALTKFFCNCCAYK